MELQKEFQKDRYRHAEFLEMIPIKEEKLVKLFLKREFQKDEYIHTEFLEMIRLIEEKLLKLFLKRNTLIKC